MRSREVWHIASAALFLAIVCRIGPAAAGNCAHYARAATGVELFGAAGGWWDQAERRYQRGQAPAVGAILVFERTRHMPSGHVAVVSEIIGRREILVDQSNWFGGSTTRGDRVIDISPGNDWTIVAVGRGIRDNPTFGFIYPQSDASGLDPYIGDKPTAVAGLVRLAVARDEPVEAIPRDNRGHRHHAAHHRAAPHRAARHEPSQHTRHRHA